MSWSRLVKAHAYGNDFLITEDTEVPEGTERRGTEGTEGGSADRAEFARRVCDRHRGIGADGLLFVQRRRGGARMRLLNADGSPSEVSGNGLRCIAAWIARTEGLSPGARITIDTDAGAKSLEFLAREGSRLTFVADMGSPTHLGRATLPVAGVELDVVVLRVGNPQCVVLGPATPARLQALGSALAVHAHFPEGTNVELADVISPSEVQILIWERGVGPTESSGTGACAAAVAAAAYGGASKSVDVVSPGGRQRVDWTAHGLRLTGWAEVIGAVDWWLP